MFLDHERPRARNKYPRAEFIIVRITLSRSKINVFIRGATDFRRYHLSHLRDFSYRSVIYFPLSRYVRDRAIGPSLRV